MCAARVVSSLDGDGTYFFNVAFLQNGLTNDNIQFQAFANDDQEFSFEKERTYDFVRSAGVEIREAMTRYLTRILPIKDKDALQDIRSVFENLFNYNAYKDRLDRGGQNVGKILRLLIFKPEIQGDRDNPEDCVAHVTFSCTTTKGEGNVYTVSTSITCHKFTWFEFQEDDFQAFLNEFQNLRLDAADAGNTKPEEKDQKDYQKQYLKTN